MSALEDLKHEHIMIGRMLTVLERLAGEVAAKPRETATELGDALRFVKGFADACHHSKEEKALFPMLSAKNATLARGPVRILTSEHDAGRTLISQIDAALPGLERGDEEAQRTIARDLTLYTRMLRNHIDKEENVLFPLAERAITPTDAEQLEEAFEAVEREMGADAHERFEALVVALEGEAGGGHDHR
ncbi:MAG TPA: hemerythrin domain-containing protein [Dehalococcoidia bacterium]|nr:hemerythrin domain-containing protein [Dehalococcoidia bacterium]